MSLKSVEKEQDIYAVNSHLKAQKAIENGVLKMKFIQ